MGKIVFGAIMPHPPILIPEIGKKRLKEAALSKKGMEEIALRLKSKSIDTIIVITPHGQVGQTSVPVYTSHVFEGNYEGDSELGREIIKQIDFAANCSETLLDHGVLVPLYYPRAAGVKAKILPIAIAFVSLAKLYEFGRSLARVIKAGNRRVAIIASADMSHRLTPDAPAGFSPRGQEFDTKLVELVKANDVQGIINFDGKLAEEAGQDALWSIAILLGTLDGLSLSPEVLSYEGPFGVGYMTAAYDQR
ncbi:MAG: AmmeMemoRadiSam system protein B [bacterium]